jgi:hypothetical protein
VPGLVPTSAPTASPVPTEAVTSPPATESPTASAVTPTPTQAFEPRWRKVGSIDVDYPDFLSLLGFDGGYVIYGKYGRSAWFSSDGGTWQRVSLPLEDERCEYDETEQIETGASMATGVVLLGMGNDRSGGGSCVQRTIALTSADGLTWQRSEPFGPRRFPLEVDPIGVWPAPAGWQAAIGDEDEMTGIWESGDGLSWTQTENVAGFGNVTGAADAHGRAVLSVYQRLGSIGPVSLVQESLVVSDGKDWTDTTAPFTGFSDGGAITAIAPPSDQRPVWTLWAQDCCSATAGSPRSGNRRTWTSADLVEWQSHRRRDFPYADLTPTSAGLIATRCRADECSQYISSDGIDWTQVAGAGGQVAEGPASVLALDGDGTVYRLDH